VHAGVTGISYFMLDTAFSVSAKREVTNLMVWTNALSVQMGFRWLTIG
jgi:hypothetical protein